MSNFTIKELADTLHYADGFDVVVTKHDDHVIFDLVYRVGGERQAFGDGEYYQELLRIDKFEPENAYEAQIIRLINLLCALCRFFNTGATYQDLSEFEKALGNAKHAVRAGTLPVLPEDVYLLDSGLSCDATYEHIFGREDDNNVLLWAEMDTVEISSLSAIKRALEERKSKQESETFSVFSAECDDYITPVTVGPNLKLTE